MIYKLLEEWKALPYDGLRGELPVWIPEFIVTSFMSNQFKIGLDILDEKLTLNEALSCFEIHRRRQELWLRQDKLLELHLHEEALEVGKLLNNLQSPDPGNLSDVFDAMAVLYEDLKLGQDACLHLWLGHEIARNNLVGEAQRDRSAAGGIESGIKRSNRAQHGAIINCAKSLRRAGEPRRGLASAIKSRGEFSMSVRQINHILKKGHIK